MKKTALFAAAALFGMCAFNAAAQDTTTPNRLLIHDVTGNYKGFVIDHLDRATFATVEGEVNAEIDLIEAQLDKLVLAVTRTGACEGFKINILPATISSQLQSDAALISYANSRLESPTYYQDFTEAEMTGVELKPASDYTVFTIAIDKFGIEAGVDRVDFTTPAIPIVGDPKVEVEVVETTLTSFTLKFTPNDDVTSYYCVSGEKGTMQQQYEMFGPMFGFTNFNDLIKAWGVENIGEATKEWTGMSPNTEYEIFISCLDENGNPAPHQVYNISTVSLGGEGEAKVEITLGEYVLNDWDGQQLPSQFITFTPNDQASCYRIGVWKAETYNAETAKNDLCQDPWMPTVGWFIYETLTTDYQINPSSSCVAVAAAKNINGEWGPMTELPFTTPETCGEAATQAYSLELTTDGIATRIMPKKAAVSITPGYLPNFKANTSKNIVLK